MFCPVPTQFRYSIALVYIFSFTSHKIFTQLSLWHAVCVPCPQPSPTRASTRTTPHLRRLWMCSQHPSTVPASKARQTSLGLAHAREASSSEPPSTERCARCRQGATSRWTRAPRVHAPTSKGTLLDILELACLWTERSHVQAPLSAPLSSTPRSPPRRQSSRAGRAPGHHFTKEGQQPLS